MPYAAAAIFAAATDTPAMRRLLPIDILLCIFIID